ncbi:MAG TPA: CCA tRNA nucleotidyltransferase [Xanthobacteraceae bacterium]|nr:CCA tRNA nucleotidyltransferase [Xanthobacteraceae bacterium]
MNEVGQTKRSLRGAAWLTQGPLPRLLDVLSGDGEEARVAGGAIRNAVMNLPPGDIDIATTATPEEVIRRVTRAGFKAVPTGIEHGTITVVADGVPFEVTTLRVDVETFGRKATVRFGRDWRADAERRDFTMNALTATADGTIHDYVGGLADLEARRVRFIGDPAMRIAEDYLRILRFFRFHAAYGEGEPDRAGMAACIAGRGGLEQLSRERVRMELVKLLVAKGVVPALTAMADAGLLGSVLGGVPLVASVARMAEIEAALGLAADPIRRLAALNVLIIEDAERLWQRLRLSNAEHELLACMGDGWRRVLPEAGEQAARAWLYRLGPEHYRNRVLLAWARAAAQPDDDAWGRLAALPQRWTAPVFPLKAADFMQRGVEKGPALGAVLRAAEEAWIAADFSADSETIGQIATNAVEGAAKAT